MAKTIGSGDRKTYRADDPDSQTAPTKAGGKTIKGAKSSASKTPDTLQPQLATLVESAPPGDWRYEIKFDGYRMLTRVIDSSSSLTKRDLAEFYIRTLDWIIPQLADRPVALVRAPEGIGAQLFF